MTKKSNGVPPECPMARETMRGDLTTWMVSAYERLPDQWKKMKESAQRAAIHETDSQARRIVAKMVDIIAADERPYVVVRVDKVTIEDKGVKLALSGIQKLDATRLQGKFVVLTYADHEAYSEGDVPTAEPDQGPLIPEAAGAA